MVVFEKGIFYITTNGERTYILDTVNEVLLNYEYKQLKTVSTIIETCKRVSRETGKYLQTMEKTSLAELSQDEEFLNFYHVYLTLQYIGNLNSTYSARPGSKLFERIRDIEKYVKMGFPFLNWCHGGLEEEIKTANKREIREFKKAYLEVMEKHSSKDLIPGYQTPCFTFQEWQDKIFQDKYPYSTSRKELYRYWLYRDIDKVLFEKECDLEAMGRLSNKLRKTVNEKYSTVFEKNPTLIRTIQETMFDVWHMGAEVNPEPYDLLREYDKWIQIKEALRYARLNQKIREVRKACLEWENREYQVVVPSSAEEILREAEQQKHCLGGYLNAIASGKNIVVFFRRKDNPSKSLITIELDKGGRMLQEKKYRNGIVLEEELKNALNEFYEYARSVM